MVIKKRADDLKIKTVNPAKSLVVAAIKIYKRFVSPLLPHSCRFYPSCSQYFIDAVEKYGPAQGSYIGLRRIFRCNQFFSGGFDPLD